MFRTIYSILLLALLMASSPVIQTQTFSEWFKQKKTQKKYLAAQILKLELYAGLLKSGYKASKDGLQFVSDIKTGEFNLHDDRFVHLKKASPAVVNYNKVILADSIYHWMTKSQPTFNRFMSSDKNIPDKYRPDSKEMMAQIVSDAQDHYNVIQSVASDGNVSMSDEERIARIEVEFAALQKCSLLYQQMWSRLYLLAKGNERLRMNNGQLRKLYNVPKRP